MKFGNAIENVWAWSDFKRIDTMLSLMARLDTLEAAQTITNAKLAIFTQGGVVFPWFKSVDDIPEGFAPVWDIAGKTIVGLDPNDADFNAVGKLFGSKKHYLSIEEMPNHKHSTSPFNKFVAKASDLSNNNNSSSTGFDNDASTTELAIGNLNATQMTTATEKAIGGNQPYNNVQSSIVAHYIEWVGLD